MHIPKTAGSSLINYFEAQYPYSEQALHIENQILGVPKEQLPSFEGKKFLSAHLKYDTLKDVLDVQKYFKVTMLRNPTDQTLSHLGWMNRLGFSENRKELEKYPDYIKFIVDRMHAMDIVSYLDTMNEHEKNFFDNCQTRYLLSIYGDVDLSLEHLNQALLNLCEFNLVGLVEKFEESLILLAYYMNWQPPPKTPRQNPSNKKYFLNLETADNDVKERFSRLISYDQNLYDAATKIFDRQTKNVIQFIARDYPEFMRFIDEQDFWKDLAKLLGMYGKKSPNDLNFRKFIRKLKGYIA